MNFILLISCMHQHDKSILTKSNVQSDVVVVNQCDTDSVEEFDFVNKYGQTKHCIFVSTTQRGLSRSRNMAVSYAPEDSICKICDDDETFADDIETKVLCAYERHPDASLIAFSMNRPDKKYGKVYPKADMHLSFSRILKTTSVEITFKSGTSQILQSHSMRKWVVEQAMAVVKKINLCLISDVLEGNYISRRRTSEQSIRLPASGSQATIRI